MSYAACAVWAQFELLLLKQGGFLCKVSWTHYSSQTEDGFTETVNGEGPFRSS